MDTSGKTQTGGQSDDDLSAEMKQLLTLMEDEYIATGYQHQGAVTLDYVAAKLGWSAEFAAGMMAQLIAYGFVQRRNCMVVAFELVPMYRVYLVRYGLSPDWENGARLVFHEHGIRVESGYGSAHTRRQLH